LVDSPSITRERARAWTSTDLVMLSVVLIWGINFSVIKLSLRSLSPLAFNSLRFTLATIILLTILRLRGETFRLTRRDLLPVIFLGLVGHTLYQLLFINGLAHTTAANSALLMATAPIFVAIYGQVLRIERASIWTWAGIILSFIGIVLLIGGSGASLRLGAETIVGDLMVLAAAMLWAAYTTGSKPLLARYSPLKLTALTMVAGTIPLVVVSIPPLRSQDWGAVTAGAWMGWLYSSLFAVVVAYLGWYTSVARVGTTRTAIYSNLTPVVAIVVAWVALGDQRSLLQRLGAAIVLAGLVLTRRGRTR
jgi:drug/metabolite transporter (DMT)-like permease